MLPFIHLLFFISGFCGLVYEVVWFRWLHQVLGVTIHSVTAVLAAFMIGLALGSRFFGRLSARVSLPLAAYGWLELGIGAITMVMPTLIFAVGRLQEPLYATLLENRPGLMLLRMGLAFVCLFPATFLMGGSFPMIAEYCTRFFRQPDRHISLLYAVNTLGAALGAATAGFILIESLGLQLTSDLASGLNVLVGLCAIFLPRRLPPDSAEEPPTTLSIAGNQSAAPSPTLFSIVTAVAGFTAMGYEVCWNRFIPLIIGSTTYGFSLILTAFLAGLALGSLASARWLHDEQKDHNRIGGLLLFAAAASAILLPLFGSLPWAFLTFRQSVQVSFEAFHLLQFLCLFVMFLPVSFSFGALFPLIARILSRSGNTGSGVGTTFWWNTLGTVGGTLLTGLLFIPALGIKQTMLLLIGGNALAGAWVLAYGTLSRSAWRLSSLVVLLLVGLCAVSSTWEKNVLTSGVYRYWRVYSPATIGNLGSTFLYFREGIAGTVSVEKDDECLSLRIDGKPDASTTKMDMSTQRLSACLPLALADSRKRVLVVGLGSGVSAGTCLLFPDLEKLDILEINPAVIEASTLFAAENERFWEHPKARLIQEDARNYVTFTRETYDVIVAEPTNLWVSGSSGLFSLEAYRSYERILNDGGIIAQFVHLYEVSPTVLASVLNTFHQVFPNVSLWLTSSNDLFMLGCKGNKPFSVEKLDSLLANPDLRIRLERLGIDRPLLLHSLLVAPPGDFLRFSGFGPINSDDFPIIDLLAPRSFYANDRVKPDFARWIFQTPDRPLSKRFPASSVSAEDWQALGVFWEGLRCEPIARQAFRMSLALRPENPVVERELAENLVKAGELQTGATMLFNLAVRTNAEKDFHRALDLGWHLDQQYPPLLEGRSLATAAVILERWKKACPTSAEPWQEEAALLSEAFPASAAQALQYALELTVASGHVESTAWFTDRLALGKLYARLDRLPEATAIWQEISRAASAPAAVVKQARALLSAME